MLRRLLHHLLARADGSMTVEFALVVPVLLLLAVSIWDFGNAFNQKMQLETAARAGLQYALHDYTDTDTIEDVVLQASGLDAAAVTVSIVQFCDCAGAQTACAATCDSGDTPATYIRVTAEKTYQALFTVYGLQDLFNLTGEAEGRVQ